ncbi:helix-turn-helix transcriptional regulator [Streptomyces sp. NPDC054887]
MVADLAAASAEFAFVGRERELASLVAALRGLPAVVIVEGEAGAGKSRLVAEGVQVLADSGTRVLTGLCHPLREPCPYGPVMEALQGVSHSFPAAKALPGQAAALSAFLPELVPFLPAVPPIDDIQQPPRRLVADALRALVEALVPCVLVVEDLHWADEATREILFLLATTPPDGLGLVLTYRRDDLPARMPVLGSPYRRPNGVGGAEIRLHPLSKGEVREWVKAALGTQAGSGLASLLFARSEGLPLVVEEDLLTLVEQQRQATGGVGDPGVSLAGAAVPRALREAVQERRATLPPAAVAVVEAAAVLAVPADQQLLAEVAGVSADEGAEGLTAALQATLLRETEPGRYGFRHVLAQQAVYQALLGPRRRALHRRTVAALRAQAAPALVQIAHHTRALGDTASWLREAEAAADEAIVLGDDGIATAILNDILDQPRIDPELRSRAALALSSIAPKSTTYAATMKTLRRIVDDPQLPRQTCGRIRAALATLMANQMRDRSGFAEMRRAVDELESWPVYAAQAMTGLIWSRSAQTPDQREEWVVRAERTLQDCEQHEGYPAAFAGVRTARITLMAIRGDAGLWDAVNALPRHSADPQEHRQTLIALFNAGSHALERGEDARAETVLRECLRLAEHGGDPSLECYARTALLTLDWLSGKWTNLQDNFSELAAQFSHMDIVRTFRALMLGHLAAARGQWATALQHFAVVGAAAERDAQVIVSIMAAVGVGLVKLAQGEAEAAWSTLTPAAESFRASDAWQGSTSLLPLYVQTAMACGHRDAAEQIVAEAEAAQQERTANHRCGPVADAELHIAHGLLLRETHPEAAVGHFEQARSLWHTIGRPYPQAQAAEAHACALAVTNPDEAATLLIAVAEQYQQLGATFDAARCHRTLRDTGFAPPATHRGRRGYGTKLSPRETEVAQFLATGATNKDIADALFLSIRTVEHHVANTLKKLGVTDREDLATTHPG